MKNLIFILFLVIMYSCSGGSTRTCTKSVPTENLVVEFQPDSCRVEGIDTTSCLKIFLAGTIDMGNSVDWQAQTIKRFSECEGRWLFFNPRRRVFANTPENMEFQVRWELEHLEKADVIFMNILGTSKSPITLLEMGLHARSGRLMVACEPAYYRYDNVRITCQHYDIPLYNSLDELLAEYNK